jgi:hypothetical protein
MGEEFRLPPLMLRSDLILPGDILLTKSIEKESGLIAVLSGGDFSHAALVINQALTFESDGDIIGFRPISWIGWGSVYNEGTRLAQVAGNPAICAIFRHPDMGKISDANFAAALRQEMKESFRRNYSELYRLVRLANLSAPVVSFATAAAKLYHHARKLENQITGPFCSELVAKFFNRLDLKLFSDPLSPCDITPNRLANSPVLRNEKRLVVESSCVSDFSSEGIPNFEIDRSAPGLAHAQLLTLRSLERVEELTVAIHNKNIMLLSRIADNFMDHDLCRGAKLVTRAQQ